MAAQREFPEWFPDWVPAQQDPAASADPPHDPSPDNQSIPDTPPHPYQPSPEREQGQDGGLFNMKPARTLYVSPSATRVVKRKLKGMHIFMITVNATLGTGLYWRGGQILELAGPLAVPLCFFIVGILSWAVMQCITELLCIWPIPGALSAYVTEFVDPELGIAVGITYWFTYSVAFGAGVATLAAEVQFWTGPQGNTIIDGTVIYTLIPLTLVLINSAAVEIYGPLEVIFGTIKILCMVVIIVIPIAINAGAGTQGHIGAVYWSSLGGFDEQAASTYGNAFLMCLSIATYAYVGVEVVAASALEGSIGKTVKHSSRWISLWATGAYTLSGFLLSFTISYDHCSLPRLSWLDRDARNCLWPTETRYTSSAFVEIAAESLIPKLDNVFNVFLVFTCITCASTNLYVASRTLFGLTSRLDGGSGQRWHLRILAYFGRTNSFGVPLRAMILSAAAFFWVPYLQLQGGTGTDTSIGMFIEILAQMGSVAVVIVWACEAFVFIRYYHCIKQHQCALETRGIPQVRRSGKGTHNDYPYRSPLQPFLAYAALAGCLFILIIANGASLWKDFHNFPFLSSYLFVLVFIAMWILLKAVRGGKWRLVDLSNPDKVVRKFRNLHDIRLAAS
ncbi:amino acid permease/ SLC12A domain-containing protein [Aspergillus stella-maris]|uniref:amino acid permease/ SLC12A domain-containing protein n=1 Tax=Aspergillus stella-maris TaxID=1810926 RepID=UPI003CCE40F2